MYVLVALLCAVSGWAQEPETPESEKPAPDAPALEAPVPDAPAPEVAAPEAPAPEAPAPEAPAPEAPAPEASAGSPSDHATFIFQGFNHYWQREVLGAWAVPHRVSLFRTGLVDERHEATEEGVRSTASWEFGQSTGVDGDYMLPRGLYSRIVAPDVTIQRGRLHFSGVDLVSPSRAPRTFQRFQDLIVSQADLGPDDHAVALVSGLTFRSRCLDDDGDCNSNGIWPYRFLVALSPCLPVDGNVVCPITVEVGRAWTPNRGGLKGIEEKPLNARMGVDIDVDYVILSGSADALTSTTFVFENAVYSNRRVHEDEQIVPVPLAGGGAYSQATVGLSTFGFVFFPTKKRKDTRQRGRYIGGWNIEITPRDYDPESGVLLVGHAGTIWLPKTVRKTGVAFELGLTALQFRHPEASVTLGEPAQGLLCSDSHGAPGFSSWKKCAQISGGVERVEQRVLVTLP